MTFSLNVLNEVGDKASQCDFRREETIQICLGSEKKKQEEYIGIGGIFFKSS
jgi:hypothetical protein